LENLPVSNEYHLDLTIDEQFLSVKGKLRLHLTNLEASALDRLYFHLYPNYSGGRIDVSNVVVNQTPVEGQLESNDTILLVLLPKILSIGEELEVAMDFLIDVPTEMGGNYGLFGYFDGVLVMDTFYPMLAVYDENGWDNDAPDPTGDLTYTDASYYLVTVHANEHVKLIASGTEIQSSLSNGEQTTTIAAGPARDFYLAASKNYNKWSSQVGEVTINSYAFPEFEEAALLALKTAENAIDIFSNHFAPYPYTEFDIISSPMKALGIEYPGITSIGINMYDFNNQSKSLPNPIALESTVAHEVGHQWFYNLIGNDQVEEPWLDESITQYATGLYYLYNYNNASAISYRSSWDSRWQRIGREEMPIGLPVSAYDNENYSPIIYGRGPYFVMALEKEMGSDVFEKFLKTYFEQYQWKNSTTKAFRQLAEDTCQCDLGTFFESWVYPQ
jgi:aminopeptidase N